MSRTIHMSHAGKDDDQPPEGIGSEHYGIKVWATDAAMAQGFAVGMTELEGVALSCWEDLSSAVEAVLIETWEVPYDIRADLRRIRQWLLSLSVERAMPGPYEQEAIATGPR